MIEVKMTVFEMVTLCSLGINAELQARIVAALEDAVGSGSTKEDKKNKKYRFSLLSYDVKDKIPVVKAVRTAYNWDLKEAKDWVEQAAPVTPSDYYGDAYVLRSALVALGCVCGPLVEDTTKS